MVRLHRLPCLLRRQHNPLSLPPSSKPSLSGAPSLSWLPGASAKCGLISSPFLKSRLWLDPQYDLLPSAFCPHLPLFLPSFPVQGYYPSVVPAPLATSLLQQYYYNPVLLPHPLLEPSLSLRRYEYSFHDFVAMCNEEPIQESPR